jgi:hypothetical protein
MHFVGELENTWRKIVSRTMLDMVIFVESFDDLALALCPTGHVSPGPVSPELVLLRPPLKQIFPRIRKNYGVQRAVKEELEIGDGTKVVIDGEWKLMQGMNFEQSSQITCVNLNAMAFERQLASKNQ